MCAWWWLLAEASATTAASLDACNHGVDALGGLSMAWRSHGRDNGSLVAALARNGILRTPRAAAAMGAVDRGEFVPPRANAYEDAPQPIGHGATISAPHMHAYALDLLEPCISSEGARVLDVGSGSGCVRPGRTSRSLV